MNSLGMPLNQR